MGDSWAKAVRERGDCVAEMILGMVSIGTSDDVLGRPQHAGYIVNRNAELQEHGGARVSKDVRCNVRA
jgi:hypothetical protein